MCVLPHKGHTSAPSRSAGRMLIDASRSACSPIASSKFRLSSSKLRACTSESYTSAYSARARSSCMLSSNCEPSLVGPCGGLVGDQFLAFSSCALAFSSVVRCLQQQQERDSRLVEITQRLGRCGERSH